MKTLRILTVIALSLACVTIALGQPKPTKWFISGRVLQKVDDGKALLVVCHASGLIGMPEPPDGSIVYLHGGNFGTVVDDDRFSFHGYPDGTYEYIATNGAKKTVRSFMFSP